MVVDLPSTKFTYCYIVYAPKATRMWCIKELSCEVKVEYVQSKNSIRENNGQEETYIILTLSSFLEEAQYKCLT